MREGFSFVNLATALAAPRIWAKVKELPSPVFIGEQIEHYTRFLREWPDPKILRTKATFETLCAILVQWKPSHELPRDLTLSAREFIAAWELGEPDEGWDTWEGHKDEDTPSFDTGAG